MSSLSSRMGLADMKVGKLLPILPVKASLTI